MKLLMYCLSFIDNSKDIQKFEQLYLEYKELLHYCAINKVQNEYLAEDAVSITFEHIAKNMYKIGEAVSPRTKRLLVTIVERTAINLYNKHQREQNRTVCIEEMPLEVLGEYREEDKIVTKAILKLPHHYQQAIILKYSLGYNNHEIAEILDCSVAKVEKLISRGKKKLETLLEEE